MHSLDYVSCVKDVPRFLEASPSAYSNKRQHRPLVPVNHTAKAFGVAPPSAFPSAFNDTGLPVRDFFALAHRGHNPNDSDFHMQARLGFKRPKATRVRLRPLADSMGTRSKLGKHTSNRPLFKLRLGGQHGHPIEPSFYAESPRALDGFSTATVYLPEDGGPTMETFHNSAKDMVGSAIRDALGEGTTPREVEAVLSENLSQREADSGCPDDLD